MEDVINLLNDNFNPISIFLYGSRARDDYIKRSDHEIGVLFSKDNYFGRRDIKSVIDREGFNIYPFKYEDFVKGNIDTPFQKNMYLYELIKSGKTISGKEVIENMKVPKIRIIDLIQDLRFNLGYALASVISDRNGDKISASTKFYKSCLFATRCLIILNLNLFPLTYNEIYNYSKKLDLGEYSNLVKKSYEIRLGKSKYESRDLFQNISYINDFIEPKLNDTFNKNSKKILIENS